MRAGGGPGPLWWRAPTRLLRQGPWALLVLAAFLLAATAAAAEVLSASAWQRVAVERVIDGVPPGASPRVAPVLRVTGVPAPGPALDGVREQVDGVPGLGRSELLGVSFGDELNSSALEREEGFVVGPDGEATARLVGVEDVADRVVVAPDGRAGEVGRRAVWLPADVAAAIGVAPGEQLEVVQRTTSGPRLVVEERVRVDLAGVLEVAEDGTTPADVPGGSFWAERATRLPADPGRGRRAAVVVAEPPVVAVLANALGDTVLWSVDAGLDPPSPTPAQLFGAAAVVQDVQRELAADATARPDQGVPLVSVTGLPGLAAAAQDVALRTVTEARSAALGAVGLGLALVLAVAALDVARRRQELALLVGLGHRPAAVGLLGAVESLPVALLAWAAALPLAWFGVLLVTGAQPQQDLLGVAAGQAALVTGVGVAVHALVTGLAATAAARRGARVERADRRGLPWRPVLVAATVAAVAGLVAAPVGDARGLDVLVPVLVAATAGALGASVLRRLLVARRRSAAVPSGVSARTLGATVLRRRLAADDGRVLVVTALAAAVGLAVHVLVGGLLVDRAVTDKAAVLAAATTTVTASYAVELDPGMPAEPPEEGPLREAEAPSGGTVVFRDAGTLPGQRRVDVAVVRPEQVGDVALWGAPGGPLEDARDALPTLADADRAATPDVEPVPVFDPTLRAAREASEDGAAPLPPPPPGGSSPVLLVGDPIGLEVGDRTTLETTSGPMPLRVVGIVPAFPGLDPDLATGVVAATRSYLPRLPNGDPRLASRSPAIDVETTELWSRQPLTELSGELLERGVEPALLEDDRAVTSASAVLVRPSFVAAGLASPYLVALAGLLLVAAVLALCLAVDRAATRTRAGDLVLARAGLGAGGTRLLLVVEAAVLLGAGVVLGVLGWLTTLPLQQRLLEPDPAVPPLVHTPSIPLVLPAALWPVVVAVLVALVAATAVAWVGSRARGQEEVLRGLR